MPQYRFEWRRYVFDVPVAIVLLCVTGILFIPIALLVRLESPGPALFRQKRIGLNGVSFTLYKFRSMRSDVEAPHADRLVRDERSDPRITRIGRVLQAAKLDELPQLANVLRGDMNLVGPRPMEARIYAERCRAWPGYARRSAARPGITGLAALHGPECHLEDGIGPSLRWRRRHNGRLS